MICNSIANACFDRFEGTFLEALVSGRHGSASTKDSLGCYFIDRCVGFDFYFLIGFLWPTRPLTRVMRTT